VSGRRAAGDELTVAERRVAELAAAGLRNKEIAARLFVEVGTVEAHLSRAYRKLGVRSRTELGVRLAEGGVTPSKV
jgi:DNA-binding NarL/FixJ family response regulator